MTTMQGGVVALALSLAASTGAFAGDDAATGRRAAAPAKPTWDFALTAYPTQVRHGDDFTSWIGAADRGALHLEARVNYEGVGARSAFVGWTFSGGEGVTWEVTPIVGGAWGSTRAFVPGVEASVAAGKLDLYVEAEYVRDHGDLNSSYTYIWSEVGWRPVDWLRAGLVAQRTRAYANERDIQRGPFAQLTWKNFTLGGFWFNPGASDQVFVLSLGATF